MNLHELTQIVSLGETAFIEFKRKAPQPERIAKEVLAFANTKGGRLLLGVDDDGTIVGVRDAEEEEFSLRNALSTHTDPPVTFSVDRIPITDKRDVIMVSVPESDRKPHYLRSGDNDRKRSVYVRVEASSIEASREAVRLMRLEKKPDNVLFELGEKELLLLRYLDEYGRITVEQFATLAHTRRDRASQTMVILARAGIIRLHTDPRGDYFTLAYDISA